MSTPSFIQRKFSLKIEWKRKSVKIKSFGSKSFGGKMRVERILCQE